MSEAYDNLHCSDTKAHYAAARAHMKTNNWPMVIEELTLTVDIYLLDAITFQQENDAANAIMAYMHAAVAYSYTAMTARSANLLTQAIEASIQEAQLYRLVAQLCYEAGHIEAKALPYAFAAAAYARVAEIYKNIAASYSDRDGPIDKASAWLMAAYAHMKSAHSYRGAGNTDREHAMYKLATYACTTAANIFHAAGSFGQEANAWTLAAKADALSAWVYRQVDDILKGADMYDSAAYWSMAAAKAYTDAGDTERAAKAYQQTVTWRTIAAQMYHDAQAHESEAIEYTEIAHLHLDLNEHALAGAAFELAGPAYQHAQDYHAAISTFQEAKEAYRVANDLIAVQRVQSIVMACKAMTRVLYNTVVERLRIRQEDFRNQVVLRIRRSNLLQDSYKKVTALDLSDALWARYKIVIVDEKADDLGDSSHEWFSLLAKEMISPSHAFFISRNPIDQTYQPNPNMNSKDDLSYYRFFGRVLALAITSGNLIHFRPTGAYLKHILCQPVAFEDLRTFDPSLYQSCVAMRQATDLSDEGLFFSVHTDNGVVELCPDGNNLQVTVDNREEYIRLVTNYYLTAQIQHQLDAFLSGFRDFVHQDYIAPLNTRVLTWLINGEPTLSVDDWEPNTVYEGCSATSKRVKWFWNTMRSFSPEQRAKLLHFVTESSLEPLGGFSNLDPKFTIAEIEQDEDHIPSANTFLHKLNLPKYSSERS